MSDESSFQEEEESDDTSEISSVSHLLAELERKRNLRSSQASDADVSHADTEEEPSSNTMSKEAKIQSC